MTRFLLIGIKPEAVDVSDPVLPPDMTAEKIADGIEAALSKMKVRGWEAPSTPSSPTTAWSRPSPLR